jgi:hypothetical protein
MGRIYDWFTRQVPGTDRSPLTLDDLQLQSPWTPSTLPSNVVFGDVFGVQPLTAQRIEAMQVPAVVKARHFIASTLAAAVWGAYGSDGTKAKTQPPWLYRTNTSTSPWHRMVWMADDLLMHGWTLLAVTRGASGTNAYGPILDAVRVPTDRWDFDQNGFVRVDDNYPQDHEVVLIPGPFEGILTANAATIRGALALETQWTSRVKNPVPVTELHNNDANDPLTTEQARELVQQYNANRRASVDGMTAYTPANIDLRTHGDVAVNLFVEGRNAVAIDVARITGLPAVLLDAANVNASNQTYTTKADARNDGLDAVRNLWAAPIEARLSMDDVCPRGQSIRADFTTALEVPTAPTTAPRED